MDTKRVGIAFGCFIPLHKGHMGMIDQASSENDFTVIGVTGHDYARGCDIIPFLRRVRLMRQIYGHRKDVIISEVDDKSIGLTGTFSVKAWRIWCDTLFRHAGLDPNTKNIKYTWYTGEDRYIEKIRQIYPNHAFVKLDRRIVPISGTEIREHLGDTRSQYEQYIHPVFNDYLRMMGNVEFEEG